jgi:hypothetical protein
LLTKSHDQNGAKYLQRTLLSIKKMIKYDLLANHINESLSSDLVITLEYIVDILLYLLSIGLIGGKDGQQGLEPGALLARRLLSPEI